MKQARNVILYSSHRRTHTPYVTHSVVFLSTQLTCYFMTCFLTNGLILKNKTYYGNKSNNRDTKNYISTYKTQES